MRYSLFMSTVYYVCGCFYLMFGVYAVASNTKSHHNRLFLLVTSSLAIWSLTYSIANSAPTAESSAFWRCMSVFGWSFFHSLLLHFVLILTNHRFQLNKPSRIILFYLPSLINVILFAPFGYLAEKQYEMVPSDFGWRNALPANIGQVWINVYYIIYTAIAVVLLIRWWRKLEPHTPLKRQVAYFLLSILLPFIVGSITDILPGMLGLKQVPRIAIPLMILPAAQLFIILRKSGVLLERAKIESLPPDSDMLPEEGRLRLFETAAAIFSIGALASLYSGYFIGKGDLAAELLLASVVLALGIFLRFIPYITKKHAIQNTLFLIIGIVGMTFFIITNADTGAVTVWAVYIVFLLYSVVLNSDIHAFLFLVATLITQIVLGITHPKADAVINHAQYLKRIFIIILSYYGVRYLTNEYASKLRGYQKFAKEQAVLERISSSFISIDSENVQEKVNNMFEMAAEILEFNQAFLFEFGKDYEDATMINVYVKDPEKEPLPYHPGLTFKTADLPMFRSLIDRNTPTVCEDTANISFDEAGQQKDYFISRGVISFYAMPIEVDNVTDGVFVVEYNERINTSLAESRLNLLKIIANILGDARKKILYEERLYHFAYFDEATKLANRNMLKKRLAHMIDNRKEPEIIAIADMELVNLRMINDTYGHSIGEQIMIKSAKILEQMLKDSCELSRVGDGEFVVVLPHAKNKEQIEACARRLLAAFSHPVLTETGVEALFVVVHMGIAVYPDDGIDAETLLKNADLARYEAENTNEKVVFYTERLESHIAENTLFTNRLFRSLENEEFFLEFQPQISCDTEKTVGFEALLRWTSDGSKRVPPDRFIPILEQTGLIYDVGLWVLEQALQTHNMLIAKGFPPLRVSVNLSVVQFQEEDFIRDVRKIIRESGVNPQYIELEITESLFSKNPEEAIEKLHQLKELGVHIAIDDFGKGYSSLSRLKSVPFDRIKIDKGIIDYIDLERKRAPITEIIILLARTFRARVTAEGVETKEQADFLRSIACNEIQGYYYSRPLSVEALEEFLIKE
ncbi:MAG: EAL domain-containing protein [Christensenellales bacterium]|jgi:diguanylate cyclase (GGDEF)-like protein